MNNILQYKDYWTDIEIDFESHLLHGHIGGIRDFVNFESDSIDGIVKEFHSAVDDYLEFCKAIGKKPDVPEALQEIAL
ncbi:MAG: hypothetical protein IJM47_06145 [Synergistaceae bacterium]|nr:hypothetical protein [Synergistaceae bacterium]